MIRKEFDNYSQYNNIKTTFTVYSVSSINRLNLVKAIKDFTGEGLKWSKELMDNLNNGTAISMTMYKSQEEINRFKSYMKDVDCKYTIDDASYIRNKKLFELGIYDKSDIVDALVEHDINLLYNSNGRIPLETLKEVLSSRYSLISEDDMKKIMID